jgi:ribosomal protein S10
MSQRIRIKLQSYDHNLVDKSAEKIVKTVRSTGAVVTGPIPLPTHKKIFTVPRFFTLYIYNFQLHITSVLKRLNHCDPELIRL